MTFVLIIFHLAKIDIRLKSSETHGDLSRIDNIEKYYSNLLQKNDESNA